jgi:uncharacterized protein YdhG (YjbR/CyaY superfamily)
MQTNMATLTTIDQYIACFPIEIQVILTKIRETISNAAPGAVESISYQMPTFKLKGNLVHFAAYKNHIGFYPAPSGIEAFKKEIALYKWAKGSVQFPIEKPIPLNLIAEIVRFRVIENMEKSAAKKK